MGNAVGCFFAALFSFGAVSFQACNSGFVAPTPPPTPPPTSPKPTPAPTPQPCNSQRHSVMVSTNLDQVNAADITLFVECFTGGQIRLLKGTCDTVMGDISMLVCDTVPGPTIEACCDNVGSVILVDTLNSGTVQWNVIAIGADNVTSSTAIGNGCQTVGNGVGKPVSCGLTQGNRGQITFDY